MAELFNITHDANNLNEYDSTVTDGGDLSTGTPGLAGSTAKMEALIDDTNALQAIKSAAGPASGDFRFRFYVDPNGLTMADGDKFTIGSWIDTSANDEIMTVNLKYNIDHYEIRFVYWDDAGWLAANYFEVTDDEHYIEAYIQRATGVGDNNGQVEVWIDGISKHTQSNIDNWDVFAAAEDLKIGALWAIDDGTSGTLYLDELKANDDGGEIGPVSAGGALPMAMYDYRRRRV